MIKEKAYPIKFGYAFLVETDRLELSTSCV